MDVPAAWLTSPLVKIEYANGRSETGSAQLSLRDGSLARVSTPGKATVEDMVTPSSVRFRELGTSYDQAVEGAEALADSQTTEQGDYLDVAVALLRDPSGAYFATPVGHTTIKYTTELDAAAPASADPTLLSAEPFWLGMDADPKGHARSGVKFLHEDVVALVGSSSVVTR